MSSETWTKIATSIEKFAGDMLSLEVITISGDITLSTVSEAPSAKAVTEVKGADGKVTTEGKKAVADITDLKRVFDAVAESIKINPTTQLKIVAYTKSEIDHDAIIYVDKAADPSLLAAHNATVLAAHTARYEALGVLAKAIGAKS